MGGVIEPDQLATGCATGGRPVAMAFSSGKSAGPKKATKAAPARAPVKRAPPKKAAPARAPARLPPKLASTAISPGVLCFLFQDTD